MDEYRKIVKRLAISKENIEIPNSDATHAAFLIATFFEQAKKEVCIFTNELHESVFNNEEIHVNLSTFLKRPNTMLRVAYQKPVTWESIRKQSKLFQVIFGLNEDVIKGKLKVYNASKIPLDWARHFALMDNEAYRYERNHEKRSAVANFGDTENAKKLSDIFNIITEKSALVFSS